MTHTAYRKALYVDSGEIANWNPTGPKVQLGDVFDLSRDKYSPQTNLSKLGFDIKPTKWTQPAWNMRKSSSVSKVLLAAEGTAAGVGSALVKYSLGAVGGYILLSESLRVRRIENLLQLEIDLRKKLTGLDEVFNPKNWIIVTTVYYAKGFQAYIAQQRSADVEFQGGANIENLNSIGVKAAIGATEDKCHVEKTDNECTPIFGTHCIRHKRLDNTVNLLGSIWQWSRNVLAISGFQRFNRKIGSKIPISLEPVLFPANVEMFIEDSEVPLDLRPPRQPTASI